MIDSTESVEGRIVESKVVGIGGHIAMHKLDRGCCGVELFLQSDGWLIEDIAEEDMC